MAEWRPGPEDSGNSDASGDGSAANKHSFEREPPAAPVFTLDEAPLADANERNGLVEGRQQAEEENTRDCAPLDGE